MITYIKMQRVAVLEKENKTHQGSSWEYVSNFLQDFCRILSYKGSLLKLLKKFW